MLKVNIGQTKELEEGKPEIPTLLFYIMTLEQAFLNISTWNLFSPETLLHKSFIDPFIWNGSINQILTDNKSQEIHSKTSIIKVTPSS